MCSLPSFLVRRFHLGCVYLIHTDSVYVLLFILFCSILLCKGGKFVLTASPPTPPHLEPCYVFNLSKGRHTYKVSKKNCIETWRLMLYNATAFTSNMVYCASQMEWMRHSLLSVFVVLFVTCSVSAKGNSLNRISAFHTLLFNDSRYVSLLVSHSPSTFLSCSFLFTLRGEELPQNSRSNRVFHRFY